MQVDHFKEEIIVRKRRGLFNLLLTLITLSMAGAGLMAAIYLVRIQGTLLTPSFSVWDIVIFLVFTLLVVGLFYIRVNIRVEYEYSFTNGELDVDKVINNTVYIIIIVSTLYICINNIVRAHICIVV